MSRVEQLRNISKDQLIALISSGASISRILETFGLVQQNSKARKIVRDKIAQYGLDTSHPISPTKYTYSASDVQQAFIIADCWSDVYRALGLTVCDHNKRGIIRLATLHNITIPQFTADQIRSTMRRGKKTWSFDNIFCEHSKYTRSNLRRQALAHNIADYICSKCGQLSAWDGDVLTLELDHINGICDDNRVDNLRWLCPNCHSQTHTFKGKNKR